MADAYGAIVVSQNDDLVADLDKICARLNEIDGWDNEGGLFEVSDDPLERRMWFNSTRSQYPNLSPTQYKFVILKSETTGDLVKIDVAQATEEDFDNSYDFESEDIPLAELAAQVTPHIEYGELTLACSSNEKNRTVEFQMIIFRADGSAERQIHSVCYTGFRKSFSEKLEAEATR